MLKNQTLLLTGAAGKVAKRLRAALSAACHGLVLTDLIPIEDLAPNERFVQCDLSKHSEVMALGAGVHKIIHFAGYPREAGWDTLIPANIIAVTNLWESALANGIKRIVYASTNHVVGFYPTDRHIGVDAQYKCDSRYGVSKAFTETVARFYFEKYGIESLGLRIGRVEDKPSDERMLSTWLHPDDLIQQVMLGLTGAVQSDILYGVSNNSKAWCSNPGAEANARALPYHPVHSADSFEDEIAASVGKPIGKTPSWQFQGGPFAAMDYVGDPARAAGFYWPQSSAV
jgi:uronate dehydrogenase